MIKALINIFRFDWLKKHDWCKMGFHDYKLISRTEKSFSEEMIRCSARLGNYNSYSVHTIFECKKCGVRIKKTQNR